MSLRGIVPLILFVLFAVPAIAQTRAADTQAMLSDAEVLLARGESAAAYKLLLVHEERLAGHAKFDYLFGVAALDTGHRGAAVLSLRRALVVAPAYSAARLELARAYFESGNRDLARPLFTYLLTENPPPLQARAIQRYLLAIDASPAAASSGLQPYAEVFTGHDSNANGATSTQNFLGFMLSPNNLENSSPFVEVAAGLDWSAAQNDRFVWLASVEGVHRSNSHASFVDATVFSGQIGGRWRHNDWYGRAAIDAYWVARDGDANERFSGIDLLLGRRVSDQWDLSVALNAGPKRYRSSLADLDVDRVLYAVAASYRFGDGARVTFAALGGSDDERQSGAPYGNSKAGARVSFAAPLGDRAALSLSAGVLTTDYDGLFFGSAREDEEMNATVQFEIRDVLVEGLSLIPRFRVVDVDSDLSLYTYDRTELGIAVRWTPR